jgi:hypothetical protein
MTTTITMQGNNNYDNKAPQTGRTTSPYAIEPCLKSNNHPLLLAKGGRRGDNTTTDDGQQ